MTNTRLVSRKFKDVDSYSKGADGEYFLLPYNFTSISSEKEILVNIVGDHLVVPTGTAKRIALHEVQQSEVLYKDLLASFIISETRIPSLIDVLATRYRTKKSFLDNFTSLHIFVVTLRCNHTCHYCQVSRVTEHKSEFDISYEDLSRAIDLMFESPSDSLTMEFQGGEPMLAFEKIKFAVERSVQLNEVFKKKITYVICTNCTIVSGEILEFCNQHNILISTSVDGPEFIHNANRSKQGANSYSSVMGGISEFRAALGHDKVSALMTTSLLSLNYPTEIIDCYISNGFTNIFLRPISPYGFAMRSPKKNHYETSMFLEFYKKGLSYIIDLNMKGTHFVEDYTAMLLRKILTPFTTGYVDLQSPAGLINSVVVFNYDGYVYASDEGRMLAENRDYTFRLGHVRDHYKKIFLGPKTLEIAESWANESHAGCAQCAFQPYCGADPVHHHATQGNFQGYKPTSSFCQKNMSIIKHLFEMIDKRGEEVLKVFYKWIE